MINANLKLKYTPCRPKLTFYHKQYKKFNQFTLAIYICQAVRAGRQL